MESVQKAKDYKRYKKYQSLHEYSLKLSNENKLDELSINILLKNYSYVENIYYLRKKYRDKYIKPAERDEGHEQYFSYLLGVMENYRTTLEEKFNAEHSKLIPKEEHQPNKIVQEEIHETRQNINNISKRLDDIIEEEHKIWNVIIPKMILKRSETIRRGQTWAAVFRRYIDSFMDNITEIQLFGIFTYGGYCFYRQIQRKYFQSRTGDKDLSWSINTAILK